MRMGPSKAMPIRHWNLTSTLSLEQKGLLVDALHVVWFEPPAYIDMKFIRNALRVDPRKFTRLWTHDVDRAFNTMRCERRPVDSIDRDMVRQKTDGVCSYCNCNLTEDNVDPTAFHVDHVKAVVRGGTSHISNLVPACRTCNLSKGARDV